MALNPRSWQLEAFQKYVLNFIADLLHEKSKVFSNYHQKKKAKQTFNICKRKIYFIHIKYFSSNQLSKVISLRCFHEIFPKIERENFRNTVWKMLRFLAHFWQKFRESNVFTKEIVDLTKYFSMTKFFYTVRKITLRACKIPIFSKSRDWDYPDFKFSIPGLVFRDWRVVKMSYFGKGLLTSIYSKKSNTSQLLFHTILAYNVTIEHH